MSDTPDPLRSYPPALAKAIRAQRAELEAKQRSGAMTVGPWAPTTRLGQPKRTRTRKAPRVADIRRRA